MVKQLKEWSLPADGGLLGERDHFTGHTFRRSLVRQALQAGLPTDGRSDAHKLVYSVTLYSQGTAPMLRLMGKLAWTRAWTERETAPQLK
jgi:hypothetical protein